MTKQHAESIHSVVNKELKKKSTEPEISQAIMCHLTTDCCRHCGLTQMNPLIGERAHTLEYKL